MPHAKRISSSFVEGTELSGGVRWEKMGRLLAPNPDIEWMSTCTGPAFAHAPDGSELMDVYVTGRDSQNRSLIGIVRIALAGGVPRVLAISPTPVLTCGSRGAFDENGVSYPCIVEKDEQLFLYYTGWMPTVLTPFQVHLGLAIRQNDGTMRRASRAPILERTNEDFLSIGSVCVEVENGLWRMWYTAFIDWGDGVAEPKHKYIIKYASSHDGIHWQRKNQVCINLEHTGEHSICRPTVYHDKNGYHMWYCYRGDEYRIGYAVSDDGVSWRRRDGDAGLDQTEEDWDSQAQCYPHVFRHGAYLYMLYCGNGYGRDGLGMARLKLESLPDPFAAPGFSSRRFQRYRSRAA